MPDPAALEMVMGMGFTREQATKALKATNNNLERAADWIFSHQAEIEAPETESNPAPTKDSFKDGSSRKLHHKIVHLSNCELPIIREKIYDLLINIHYVKIDKNEIDKRS